MSRLMYLGFLFIFLSCNSNKSNVISEEEEFNVITNLFSELFILEPPLPMEGITAHLSKSVYLYDSLVMAREEIAPIEERKKYFTREFRPLLDKLVSLNSRKIDFSSLQISEEVEVKSVNNLDFRGHPFFILSRISFNEKFNKGILYLQYACYGCSYSELVAIEKVKEQWRIAELVTISIE